MDDAQIIGPYEQRPAACIEHDLRAINVARKVGSHVLLFEPATTLNTGNVNNERTVIGPERV